MRKTRRTVSTPKTESRRPDEQLGRPADRGQQRDEVDVQRRVVEEERWRPGLRVARSGRPVSTMWRPTSRKMCSSKVKLRSTGDADGDEGKEDADREQRRERRPPSIRTAERTAASERMNASASDTIGRDRRAVSHRPA